MSLGKIGTFDLVKDNWDLYVERLEQYFIANDVKEAVRVATLITAIGGDAYELMVSLCTPDRPASKTFPQLVAIMKNHLQPQPSILAERYKFRQRKQMKNESVADYVAELKRLSKNCNFGSWLKESLRDQFVCGLTSDVIRQRLFAEDNLNFDTALKVAVTVEAAESNAGLVDGRSEYGDRGSATTAVHQMATGGARRDRHVYDASAGAPGRARVDGGGGQSGGGGSTRVTWRNGGARGGLTGRGARGAITSWRNSGYMVAVTGTVTRNKFCEVFADGLGRFTGEPVTLRVRPGARPVYLRARPLAYALREPVERALDQLVQDGIITPVETSDWATPIVPVVKKDGSIRVCGDFKLTLNKCLDVDRFPVPKVDDLLTKLHGGERYTKIDLSQAYAQLVLDESKKYAVINTHKGLFRYNRLIYGLSSSPGIFQRKLEQMFADMPKVGVFLDDVIITGSDDREHMGNLNKVFERLQKYGLRIRKDKCTFFAHSVTYLGYTISKEGVHTCPEKVEAIRKVERPKNVSELRSFLGMVMYYAKFVANISTLLEPLYSLLKKNVTFTWSERCEEAFNEVKRMLVSSEVLAHYSPEMPLVLTTDASSVGVGSVLSHLVPTGGGRGQAVRERPVAYASRVLNEAERSYSQIEKEALAIIFGIRKFHQYLYGRKFTLRTDHKPLVSIFGKKTGIPVMAACRMQRWAVLLSGYNYDIEYVPSKENGADALSRLPLKGGRSVTTEQTYFNFVQFFLPLTRKQVKESTDNDEVLPKVIMFIRSGWPHACEEEKMKPYFARRNELYVDMGCVMWGYRLCIPEALKGTILKELHVGHLGIVKMKSVARSYVWWPGVDADVERACRECAVCVADSTAPPRAPPTPWTYHAEPWTRLHIDFLGPFHGRTFLIIVDSSSKWIEAFSMERTTASAVIKVLRETFARFGLPREVVSDNGPPFSSREYLEFLTNNGVKASFSAIYHPASNGAAESAVKLCKRAVRKSLRDGVDMDAALQSYLMAYRNVEHSTTGVSPASLLQRRSLRSRLDLLRGDQCVAERVQQAQQRQVKYAGGTDRKFSVGEVVWVRDYTGQKWVSGRVEDKLGSRNYLVRKDDGPQVKRHVDQIKKKFSPMYDLPGPSTMVSDGETAQQQQSGDAVSALVIPALPHADEERAGPPAAATAAGSAAQSPPISFLSENRPQRVTKPVKRYGFDID